MRIVNVAQSSSSSVPGTLGLGLSATGLLSTLLWRQLCPVQKITNIQMFALASSMYVFHLFSIHQQSSGPWQPRKRGYSHVHQPPSMHLPIIGENVPSEQ